MYVDDLAEACVVLAALDDAAYARALAASRYPLINIGCGEDATITELARTVADVVGFEGALVHDASKPDGAPRKLLDSSRMAALGWKPRISLREGIARAYREALVAKVFG